METKSMEVKSMAPNRNNRTNINAFLLSLLILVFSFHTNAQEEFTSKQVKKYKNGIFEVVTLKQEDTTEYKEAFPHDLIPFQVRNDKYYSLGTAFLIDDKTFVSAAHVFGIGQTSQLSDDYALRDTEGNIFEIDQVQKLSNYRDIIQFTVKQNTQGYFEFTIADSYEAGDTIYAAGNALGEGVIFRKGTLTSFTYEPVNGVWKDIRFSAAASPGNSGGPLLNLQGEVVGIVTKKSNNENLNYAFPIKDFMAFTDKEAEFFNKGLAEVESDKRLSYTWKDSAPLPQGILTLRRFAEKSLLDRLSSGRAEFVKKYEGEIFPNHPKVPKYLKNQADHESLSIIDVNANGEWYLYEPAEETKVAISAKQSMWFSQNSSFLGSYQFFMEKPEEESLQAFISNPKQILDTFLTSVQWNRTIASTPVHILSYGEPVITESYTDKYGRVWSMSTWNDTYSDQALIIYCLPMPQGVVCDLAVNRTMQVEVLKNEYTNNLHRIMLSYTAKLSEWEEFLSLPKKVLPSHLHEAQLKHSEDKTTFALGAFNAEVAGIGMTPDSNLYAAVTVNVDDTNMLDISMLSLQPNINEDTEYSINTIYDLGEDSSDSYADFWKKLSTQQAPYDNQVVDEGNNLQRTANLSALGKVSTARGMAYMARCRTEARLGEKHLEETCDGFINSLKVK